MAMIFGCNILCKDMTAENVQKQAQGIASDLARIRMEG